MRGVGRARRDGALAGAGGRVQVLQRTREPRGVRAAPVWTRDIGGGAECVATVWKGGVCRGGGGERRRGRRGGGCLGAGLS